MSTIINAVAKRYRYTGKERDEETGLYYHGARYYIPWLCRWTAVDPLEAKFAGRTPYCYSANNPVMFNDPSGMHENPAGKGKEVQSNGAVYSANADGAKYTQGAKAGNSGNNGTKPTGIDIFNQRGNFLGRIDSNETLEIHFVNLSNMQIPNFNDDTAKEIIYSINKLSEIERGKFIKVIKEISFGFIGKNSFQSLDPIVEKSARMDNNLGRELGFYPTLSDSKEIIFKEFKMAPMEVEAIESGDDRFWNQTTFPMNSTIRYYYEQGGATLLGEGHTHTYNFYENNVDGFGSVPGIKLPLERMTEKYGVPSHHTRSLEGVKGDFDRDKDGLLHFVGFKGGLTIYMPGENPNNYYTYISDWFK